MKKVFSKKVYYQQTGDRSCYWAEECDGLTAEEMHRKGYATHHSWMIEVNESEEKKNMTIDELEFGDIVTQRNGERYVIASGRLYGEDENYYNDCDEIDDYYKNDLKYHTESRTERDIVKVERDGSVIYERNDVRELTIKEISELLGYEVKVVKEK